jgi:hypothetical protein
MGSHKSVSSLESDVLARRITETALPQPHTAYRIGEAAEKVRGCPAATGAARTAPVDLRAAIHTISGKWRLMVTVLLCVIDGQRCRHVFDS